MVIFWLYVICFIVVCHYIKKAMYELMHDVLYLSIYLILDWRCLDWVWCSLFEYLFSTQLTMSGLSIMNSVWAKFWVYHITHLEYSCVTYFEFVWLIMSIGKYSFCILILSFIYSIQTSSIEYIFYRNGVIFIYSAVSSVSSQCRPCSKMWGWGSVRNSGAISSRSKIFQLHVRLPPSFIRSQPHRTTSALLSDPGRSL